MLRGLTFLLGLSNFDRRNAGKISLFLSSPFLSLSHRFSFSLPCILIHPISLSCLSLLSFYSFHFPFSFSFFSFSLFSLFPFLFYFCLAFPHFFSFILRIVQVGKLPPHLPTHILTCHMSCPQFFLIFLILFLFLLFPSFDTWLNVSYSHKCTT